MVPLEIFIAERLGSLAAWEVEVVDHEVDSAVGISMRRKPSADIVKRVINIENHRGDLSAAGTGAGVGAALRFAVAGHVASEMRKLQNEQHATVHRPTYGNSETSSHIG